MARQATEIQVCYIHRQRPYPTLSLPMSHILPLALSTYTPTFTVLP